MARSVKSPCVGVIFESMGALSVIIMFSVTLFIRMTVKLEVKNMSTIILMCLTAGTTLLGRSGGMFPKSGEKTLTIRKSTVNIWEECGEVRFLPRPADSLSLGENTKNHP